MSMTETFEPVGGDDIDHAESTTAASKLILPMHDVVCVEHPCIIQDVDRAIKSLGDERQVQHLLAKQAPPNGPVSLSLRPDDPFATRILAKQANVNHILLRIDLPKWTGRKRKRGSNEPFRHHDMHPGDAEHVLKLLRDNAGKYAISPVGRVQTVHRFRTLPDFQFAAGDNPMMRNVASHLINPSLADIKKFQIDRSIGSKKGASIIGPPLATLTTQQLNYIYEQESSVVTTTDEFGSMVTFNTQAPRKRDVYAIPADIEVVPQAPPDSLPPLTTANEDLHKTVTDLRNAMKDRPILTRRVAMDKIGCTNENLFKDATQYVGYAFRSGPWRDALVSYGCDPRKDPKYRIYQTIVFKMAPRDKAAQNAQVSAEDGNQYIRREPIGQPSSDGVPSYIFDGKRVSTIGKTWQVCDVEDPVVKKMYANAPLRAECDIDNWGWYQNGTMSIGRVLMRDKTQLMLQNFDPDTYDQVYAQIASLPAVFDESTLEDYSYAIHRTKNLIGKKAQELTSAIRAVAKTEFKTRGLQHGNGAGRGRPGWIAGNGKAASSAIDGQNDFNDDDDGEEPNGEEDDVDDNEINDLDDDDLVDPELAPDEDEDLGDNDDDDMQ